MKISILVVIICLMLGACSRTIYNVQYVENPKCDTAKGHLFLRIINNGKIGVSSIRFQTDSGWIRFGGVKPHDTTCYFPIPSVYSNPANEAYVLRLNSFGKAWSISSVGTPIDHAGDTKFTSGYCTLHISVIKKKGEMKIQNFTISQK